MGNKAVNVLADMRFPRRTFPAVIPLGVRAVVAFFEIVFQHDRRYSTLYADSVRQIPRMLDCRPVAIELLTVKGVSVQDYVGMQMFFIRVRCDNCLSLVAEVPEHELFCYGLHLFRCNVVIG